MDEHYRRLTELVVVAVIGVFLGITLARGFTASPSFSVDTSNVAGAISMMASQHSQTFLLSADGRTLWVIDPIGEATVWQLEGNINEPTRSVRQWTDHPFNIHGE